MSSTHLSIGDLSRATGTKVETIRFYEKNGLLPQPGRTEGNYRAYEPAHLNRLSFIRRARDLGFSLDQVRALLTLSDDRSQSCAAVDVIARAHRDEVERKIKDLQSLKVVLDQVIESCHCNIVADCAIIESLAPTPEAS
ncbi:helix-turn-helix domain-containing protein [Asticcacaulis sp. BYS171W]|uniref:Helix-turn-helix domain-containing protein n=1 Tax=Asticcacaulis aquaticus TaxID=2984212 RepID=A0ABT5HWN1_9CAUL|nr:helix-turn-helix domain-containing protein [Asticcacaulis aquaticus]MDC7684496.1 helix-turn-helix domain-containing protein [Asticcacaulis aquaticus]